MTEKELKKLNRYQLLELLLVQTERVDHLQKKVEELEQKLEARELDFSELGSIAEAALYISGVFKASQQAVDYYMDSARKKADAILEDAQNQAASILADAEEKVRCLSNTSVSQNVEIQK